MLLAVVSYIPLFVQAGLGLSINISSEILGRVPPSHDRGERDRWDARDPGELQEHHRHRPRASRRSEPTL